MNAETRPLASIIINNFNYDSFLQIAIDSALGQTYPHLEVIVVDDGSTDNSRQIISSYGERIVPVLKSNGGQASSLNEGFKASRGEIVFLLDSDDIFHPEKVEKVIDLFCKNELLGSDVMFFNSFEAIDSKNIVTNSVTTTSIYEDWSELAKIRGEVYTGGDRYFFNGEIHKVCTPDLVYKFASNYRTIPFIGMPSSNIAISRTLASKVFPLPVTEDKTCADNFMVRGASLVGSIYSTNLTLTQYRIHGENAWLKKEKTRELDESTSIAPDEYLNSRLIAAGKKPVLSFLDSMSAAGFYRQWMGYKSADNLIELAFSVVRYRLDFETLSFFIKTFTRGIYYKFKLLWLSL